MKKNICAVTKCKLFLTGAFLAYFLRHKLFVWLTSVRSEKDAFTVKNDVVERLE